MPYPPSGFLTLDLAASAGGNSINSYHSNFTANQFLQLVALSNVQPSSKL